MRLRIPNAPAGEWRGLERVAFAVFGVGVALVVVGLFSLKIRHPGSPAVTIAPAPAPAASPAIPPAVRPAEPKHEPAPAENPRPAADKPRPPADQPKQQQAEPKHEPAPVENPRPAADKPRPPADQPKQHGLELHSQGSMILLARDEATALEMRKTPDHISEMVAQGRAFSAPNHTAVFIEEVRGKLMRVRILHDSLAGRVGWVRADQVARW